MLFFVPEVKHKRKPIQPVVFALIVQSGRSIRWTKCTIVSKANPPILSNKLSTYFFCVCFLQTTANTIVANITAIRIWIVGNSGAVGVWEGATVGVVVGVDDVALGSL